VRTCCFSIRLLIQIGNINRMLPSGILKNKWFSFLFAYIICMKRKKDVALIDALTDRVSFTSFTTKIGFVLEDNKIVCFTICFNFFEPLWLRFRQWSHVFCLIVAENMIHFVPKGRRWNRCYIILCSKLLEWLLRFADRIN